MAIYSDIANAPKKSLTYDIDSIYQSISNILTTKIGERFFNPEFGANLDDLVFEYMDPLASTEILVYVFNAIARWENRVIIVYNQCLVTPDMENHIYEVLLAFRVKGLDDQTYQTRGIFQM